MLEPFGVRRSPNTIIKIDDVCSALVQTINRFAKHDKRGPFQGHLTVVNLRYSIRLLSEDIRALACVCQSENSIKAEYNGWLMLIVMTTPKAFLLLCCNNASTRREEDAAKCLSLWLSGIFGSFVILMRFFPFIVNYLLAQNV
ncbi:hypothetical protein L596_010095 [Steinernema carpocapsae]|uniref:Uncharacterized protein n=1 Tax=Steinernema carpocapsae TaxID=34508 RepID=A0A4U5PHT1_STECR|nr:hypothetical protein L596_010095 [Steinernema carpocapsae]